MYADLKILNTCDAIDDLKLLQSDIDRFVVWCQLNHVEINSKNCYHMRFTWRSNAVELEYYIGGNVIEKTDIIKDLGVL